MRQPLESDPSLVERVWKAFMPHLKRSVLINDDALKAHKTAEGDVNLATALQPADPRLPYVYYEQAERALMSLAVRQYGLKAKGVKKPAKFEDHYVSDT